MISTGKCTSRNTKLSRFVFRYNYMIRDNYVTDSNRGPDSIVNISFSYLNLFEVFQVLFNIV